MKYKFKEMKQKIENSANKITSNWLLTKLIISLWISFIIVKKFFISNLFIYNQSNLYWIITLVWILTILLYFTLNQIVNILKIK